MDINALPFYDISDRPTQCCPRFHPEGWEHQDLHFRDKLFAKASTRSLFHIPLNMGSVFNKAFTAIHDAHGSPEDTTIVLSREVSPWRADHYFLVDRPVPGLDMARLTGDFLTRVFEGPYRDMPKWEKALAEEADRSGKTLKKTYFFYTTCPKCAKVYGENYVVGFAEVE